MLVIQRKTEEVRGHAGAFHILKWPAMWRTQPARGVRGCPSRGCQRLESAAAVKATRQCRQTEFPRVGKHYKCVEYVHDAQSGTT